MRISAKNQIREALLAWFAEHQRPLPWRRTREPYAIWVSEVMLQQTQVNTVIPYYLKFMRRFPDVHRLAAADLQAVLKVWEGMGYYARARNLHRSANRVVEQFGGKVPGCWKDFRQLPGVGDYIAAAVLSIAFGKPRAVVDGNVKRVLSRLFLVASPVNVSGAATAYKALADALMDPRRPGMYNQALMELGATVCRQQNPACGRCPLAAACGARRSDRVSEFPKRVKAKPVPEYPVAVGVVYRQDRVLIARRRPDGLLGGLWEFPGGKVGPAETAQGACVREIREELNIAVEVVCHLARVRHAYTHFKIVMDVFCCRFLDGTVKLNGPVDHGWVAVDALDRYPFPTANRKFIPLLPFSLA